MANRQAYAKLYKTKRWKELRRKHLAKHPYCQCPHHEGKYVEAEVVDHVIPHKGDTKLFYGGELQSLTKQCHDSMKQSQERGGAGFNKGCDINGWPIGESHWNE